LYSEIKYFSGEIGCLFVQYGNDMNIKPAKIIAAEMVDALLHESQGDN
jgi:hypothetical protein